ncbi:hypothetical protein FACS189452_04580 [Bacteroidia bacterium]|nr:hypothetical protein FACS189452_04580 [Bacteroidia bacterium]
MEKRQNSKGLGIFASWLIDVSKYLVTGVFISSIFKDMDSKFMVYLISAIVGVSILSIGIYLKSKEKTI